MPVTNLSGGSLEKVKDKLLAQIDHEAESIRAAIVTLAPGQAMAYARKKEEATLVLQGIGATAEQAPHVFAEAEVEGITPQEMAERIVASEAEWVALSVQIEVARIGHKRDVQNATNPQQARDVAFIDWSPFFIP